MPAEFGATPWGRAWMRTVESTSAAGPNALLPKARSLARNHAATLTTETGRVTARVAASGAVNTVQIDLPPWPDTVRAEAEGLIAKALADNPGLATGDLPDSLESDFADHGVSVAVGLAEQRSTCDCRARKRPCVHILATIYTLSMKVDERPALAVELRCAAIELAPAPDPDWIPLGEIDVANFSGD
jgi:uncharacterized Zn finger protein